MLKVGIMVDAKKEHHFEKQMNSFRETFDLIIAHDGSFEPLVDTMQVICGQKPKDRKQIIGHDKLAKLLNDI